MGLNVTVQFANPDPALKFTTQQAEVDMLNSLVSAETDDDVTTYIIGDSTPSVDDQDKVWHRTTSNGNPLGTYIYYNGLWVREAPHVGARLSFFSGDPTPWFDATGLGIRSVAGPIALDYFGWALANGQHGTANLSDQFIICARMDNIGITGWDNGTQLWRTNIDGVAETQGGHKEITTDANTAYRSARSIVKGGKYSASGNVQGGSLWGDANGSTDFTVLEADPGNITPLPINIVNPFYAMAFMAWVGYDTYY